MPPCESWVEWVVKCCPGVVMLIIANAVRLIFSVPDQKEEQTSAPHPQLAAI